MSDVTWHVCVTIGQVALLVYLVVAVTTVIVVRRRRLRAQWADYLDTDLEVLYARGARPGQTGYEASVRGAGPRTPLPDWMYEADDADGGVDGADDAR